MLKEGNDHRRKTKMMCGRWIMIIVLSVAGTRVYAADGFASRPAETPLRQLPEADHPSRLRAETSTVAPPTSPTTPAPSFDPLLTIHGANKAGYNCVVLQGKFRFTIPYQKKDNSVSSVDIGVHDLIKTTCDCGANEKAEVNLLEVEFFQEGWKMAVGFGTDKPLSLGTEDNSTFWWQQVNITYLYSAKYMPGLNSSLDGRANTLSTVLQHHVFNASSVGSFRCNGTSEVEFPEGGSLHVTELQYMAFAKNTTEFPSHNVTECVPTKPKPGNRESFVPVAMGAALAGLVLIVLIAYLIGRARAKKKKEYESV